MKNILTIIEEYNTNNFFNNIDSEIINEKLKEPHLIEIATNLRKFSKYRKDFKNLFGRFAISWDEITESDFEKYNKGDKTGIKEAKKCLKSGDNFMNYLIVFFDDDDKIYAIASCYGLVMFYTGKTEKKYDFDKGEYIDVDKKPDSYGELKQKEITEECESCNHFWILDLSKFKVYGKQNERQEARKGSINTYDYEKIARENRERYNKIIAKRRANKIIVNDTISPKVKSIMDEVLELTTKLMAGGAKYADLIYSIESLLNSCYDKTVYTGNYKYGHNGLSGSDGLLVLYKKYIDTTMRSAKGSSPYTTKPEEYITQINDKISEIQSTIKMIKDKM